MHFRLSLTLLYYVQREFIWKEKSRKYKSLAQKLSYLHVLHLCHQFQQDQYLQVALLHREYLFDLVYLAPPEENRENSISYRN